METQETQTRMRICPCCENPVQTLQYVTETFDGGYFKGYCIFCIQKYCPSYKNVCRRTK